jgi:hypothetical protein
MTKLKAKAECQALCEELKAKIDGTFAHLASEECQYHPTVVWVNLYELRQDLLRIRKNVDVIDKAMRQGDSVVPFKIVA